MKSNQLVLLLGLVAAGVAGFIFWQKQKAPVRAATPPTAATDQTSAYLGFASSLLDRVFPASS